MGAATRKVTKIEFCNHHAPRFAGDSRYRKIESMLEGGYGGGPCKGGRCRLYPGLDYICRETCEQYGMEDMPLDWTVTPRERLEYLRERIEAEDISWGEIAELQGLAEHIDPGDVLLLEWAGVPEDLEERAAFFAERTQVAS